MRNVEIKARITNYDEICETAEKLSGKPAVILNQDDTFYNVSEGRLKMRFLDDCLCQLVRYSRDDAQGPKLSEYEVLEFTQREYEKGKQLDEMLRKCLGVKGRIVKQRKLFLVGQTRIHIDAVKGLGNFMELEVVLDPEQTLEDGKKIAVDLQNKLGVRNEDLIKCAYVDMMLSNGL